MVDSTLHRTGIRAVLSQEIEQEITLLLQARSHQARSYGPAFARLWDITSHSVLGGKLLRPRLLVGAFDALTSDTETESGLREQALRIAAAIELLHFAFLLHDDVIDEDVLRRGEPNLIGQLLHEGSETASAQPTTPHAEGHERRLHWARSNGILMGDLMLAAAHQVFARAALSPSTRLRLLDLLDYTVVESVAGEQSDVGLGDGIIASELSAVLEMTRLKTATYSFELPLRAAAILAGSSDAVETALVAVSRHLGAAFQLQDDLLSAFGSSREHGKDPFSDFREGKETAIIAYARQTALWPRIEPLFGTHDLDESAARTMQALLAECGAHDFIRTLIDDQIRAGWQRVRAQDSPIPPTLAEFIRTTIDSLKDRRS